MDQGFFNAMFRVESLKEYATVLKTSRISSTTLLADPLAVFKGLIHLEYDRAPLIAVAAQQHRCTEFRLRVALHLPEVFVLYPGKVELESERDYFLSVGPEEGIEDHLVEKGFDLSRAQACNRLFGQVVETQAVVDAAQRELAGDCRQRKYTAHVVLRLNQERGALGALSGMCSSDGELLSNIIDDWRWRSDSALLVHGVKEDLSTVQQIAFACCCVDIEFDVLSNMSPDAMRCRRAHFISAAAGQYCAKHCWDEVSDFCGALGVDDAHAVMAMNRSQQLLKHASSCTLAFEDRLRRFFPELHNGQVTSAEIIDYVESTSVDDLADRYDLSVEKAVELFWTAKTQCCFDCAFDDQLSAVIALWSQFCPILVPLFALFSRMHGSLSVVCVDVKKRLLFRNNFLEVMSSAPLKERKKTKQMFESLMTLAEVIRDKELLDKEGAMQPKVSSECSLPASSPGPAPTAEKIPAPAPTAEKIPAPAPTAEKIPAPAPTAEMSLPLADKHCTAAEFSQFLSQFLGTLQLASTVRTAFQLDELQHQVDAAIASRFPKFPLGASPSDRETKRQIDTILLKLRNSVEPTSLEAAETILPLHCDESSSESFGSLDDIEVAIARLEAGGRSFDPNFVARVEKALSKFYPKYPLGAPPAVRPRVESIKKKLRTVCSQFIADARPL